MKKQLLAGVALLAAIPVSAMAADLGRPAPAPAPVYSKAPPPIMAFSWTGFYLGGNLGAAWENGNVTDSFTGLNFSGTSNATFAGGGQAGFNYQISSLVFGVEADFDWLSNNNNNTGVGVAIPGGGGDLFTANLNDRWVTTLTGRLGFAWDRVLLYGKGGGAWVGNNGFTVTDTTKATSLAIGSSSNRTGWTAGGGLEWAFANNWTARVEYDYIKLSNTAFTVPAGAPIAGDVFTVNRNISLVTVGLNYLFNWGGPVTARY
jgi:outer membrane immunogenic protein